MFFFVLYLLIRLLVRVLAGNSAVSELEIENAAVRHQLAVMRRSRKRLPLRRLERLLLAAASGLLVRERWWVFLVSPQTLLRTHRPFPVRDA